MKPIKEEREQEALAQGHDPKYQYSPCHNVLNSRVFIYLYDRDKNERQEIGHIGLCSQCFQASRSPTLYRSAPPGYMGLWPRIKQREAGQSNAFDVKIEEGILMPYDSNVGDERKMAGQIGFDRKEVKIANANQPDDDEVPF